MTEDLDPDDRRAMEAEADRLRHERIADQNQSNYDDWAKWAARALEQNDRHHRDLMERLDRLLTAVEGATS